MSRPLLSFLAGLLAVGTVLAQAPLSPRERARADYPFLSRCYAEVGLGMLDYNESGGLPEGYVADRYSPNGFSGRLLLGAYLTDGLAVQYSTLRPAAWMKYHDVNGTTDDRTAFFNVWSLSLRQRLRLGPRLGLHLEAGLANVTRKGFGWTDGPVLPSRHYVTGIAGASLSYAVDPRWDLFAQAVTLPRHRDVRPVQHYSAGARLHFRRLVPRAESLAGGAYFPERSLRIGYGTSAIGFAVNEFFSMQLETPGGTDVGLPIFWRGKVEARHTLQVGYERQVYRGRKVFALGWGASATAFQSEGRTWVAGASVYPVLNFYFLRRRAVQPYVTWSVIGPTVLSEVDIDGVDTGPHITYQDFLGVGAHLGPRGRHNLEAKIEHYSNGNIFNRNAGVAVPVVLSYGWNW